MSDKVWLWWWLNMKLVSGVTEPFLVFLPSFLAPHRLQQDSSLLPSERSPDGSHQDRCRLPHLRPTSPRHPGSPEASDSGAETERRRTEASTPEISVSSDSEFETWGDGLLSTSSFPTRRERSTSWCINDTLGLFVDRLDVEPRELKRNSSRWRYALKSTTAGDLDC